MLADAPLEVLGQREEGRRVVDAALLDVAWVGVEGRWCSSWVTFRGSGDSITAGELVTGARPPRRVLICSLCCFGQLLAPQRVRVTAPQACGEGTTFSDVVECMILAQPFVLPHSAQAPAALIRAACATSEEVAREPPATR